MKTNTRKELQALINLNRSYYESFYFVECQDMHLIDLLSNYNADYLGSNSGINGLNWKAYEFECLKNLDGFSRIHFIALSDGPRNCPRFDGQLFRDSFGGVHLKMRSGAQYWLGRISTIEKEHQFKLEELEKELEKTKKTIDGVNNFKELNSYLKSLKIQEKNLENFKKIYEESFTSYEKTKEGFFPDFFKVL